MMDFIPKELDYNTIPQVSPAEIATSPDWSAAPKKTPAVIKIAAFSVAAASAVASLWYSFGWFSALCPPPLAAILSIIVVMVNLVSPVLARTLWVRARHGLAVAAALSGVFCALFSMTNTVARTYNARDAIVLEGMAARATGAEAARLRDEIQRLNRSIDTMQTRIDAATQAGKKDPDAAYLKRKDEAKKAEYEAALARIDTGQTIARDDFYTFAGGVLGINAATVELALAGLPAVMIDVIGPLFALVGAVL